jgi:hypothetical protein
MVRRARRLGGRRARARPSALNPPLPDPRRVTFRLTTAANLIDADVPKGAGRFYTGPRGGMVIGMVFRCPRCGRVSEVRFTGPAASAWDGNRLRPTISPSILHDAGGCGWNGHLRAGIWEPV